MDNELKEIRSEISNYENKLIDLITERISLGEKVAKIKYKYIKEFVDNADKSSIYDVITNKIVKNKIYSRLNDNIEDETLAKLIIDWTKDDKGRNILYKNNGEERYPEFKLYKMIVRTVHKHLPETQLSNKLFSSFISSKRKIKKQKIINIDKMESMC